VTIRLYIHIIHRYLLLCSIANNSIRLIFTVTTCTYIINIRVKIVDGFCISFWNIIDDAFLDRNACFNIRVYINNFYFVFFRFYVIYWSYRAFLLFSNNWKTKSQVYYFSLLYFPQIEKKNHNIIFINLSYTLITATVDGHRKFQF